MGSYTPFSPLSETRSWFRLFTEQNRISPGLQIPEFQEHARHVSFDAREDDVFFPCPFPQTEAVSVLKAIEGCWAACIADIRWGKQNRSIKIQLERSARYLLGSYLFSIDGLTKLDPEVKTRLKDTDLKKAQSILYRRFSTSLYATKIPGEYFHLHGSLDASTALQMIGMEPFRPDLTDYEDCKAAIESQMMKHTVDELEAINAQHKQAGVTAYKREAFVKTEYGQNIIKEPKWTVSRIEQDTPPVSFAPTTNKKILSGIKVLELCRVIAGPSICRVLTEYGATVLKVTSPNLSDVPFFQIEGNMGKHTTDLDLKSVDDRKAFEELLRDADVLVDGYRTGAIRRLGYGPEDLTKIAKARGRGFVYVSENCFGYGKDMDRPGWQQIADSVSGVAWAQGKFMGLDEPCVPPFPMSDYGTGLMGAIATLEAVFLRARDGGSYHARCCLVQYDNLLFEMGQYPEEVQDHMRQRFAGPFFDNRHADSTDRFSATALRTMWKTVPVLFADEPQWSQRWVSRGYGSVEVKCIKPWSNVEGVEMGYERATRPNGTDEPKWVGWEVEEPLSGTVNQDEIFIAKTAILPCLRFSALLPCSAFLDYSDHILGPSEDTGTTTTTTTSDRLHIMSDQLPSTTEFFKQPRTAEETESFKNQMLKAGKADEYMAEMEQLISAESRRKEELAATTEELLSKVDSLLTPLIKHALLEAKASQYIKAVNRFQACTATIQATHNERPKKMPSRDLLRSMVNKEGAGTNLIAQFIAHFDPEGIILAEKPDSQGNTVDEAKESGAGGSTGQTQMKTKADVRESRPRRESERKRRHLSPTLDNDDAEKGHDDSKKSKSHT